MAQIHGYQCDNPACAKLVGSSPQFYKGRPDVPEPPEGWIIAWLKPGEKEQSFCGLRCLNVALAGGVNE